jgi:hypothetical protein
VLHITISKRSAIIIAVALLLIIPTTAIAQSLFNDVAPGSTHEPGIGFMKDSGVTVGCNAAGTEYCPSDAVTREQMATFMYRLSGNEPNTAPSVLGASTLEFATKIGGFEVDETNSDRWVTVDGFSVTQVIPEGRTARIMATYSAESVCEETLGSCYIRIMANGQELGPSNYDSGNHSDIIWDSPENATSLAETPWESHTTVRISDPLPAGTYTITVQMYLDEPPTEGRFRLDDMLLATELHVTG